MMVAESLAVAPWGWGVFITLAIIAARLRPIMTKLAQQREQTLLAARAADNKELRRRVRYLEVRQEIKETIHSAELSLDRHRFNNVNQCFDALVLLLEQDPGKAQFALEKIKEMRSRQMEIETVEKAQIHKITIEALAKLDAIGDDDDDDETARSID